MFKKKEKQKLPEPLIGKRLEALRDKMWFICEHGSGECIYAGVNNNMFFSFDTIYGKRLVVVYHNNNFLTMNKSNIPYRRLMYFEVTEDKPLCDLVLGFLGFLRFGFLDHTKKLFSVNVDNNNKVEIYTYNECKYITKKEMDLALLEVENKVDEVYDKYKQIDEESQRDYEVLQEYTCKLDQQFQTEY